MINIIKDTKITKFHQNLLRLQLSEVEMVQSQKKAQKMGMAYPISFDCITRGQKTNFFNATSMTNFFPLILPYFSAMNEVRRPRQENLTERA